MKKKILQGIIVFVVLLFSACVFGEEPGKSTVPSDEKIRQILTDRLGQNADPMGE